MDDYCVVLLSLHDNTLSLFAGNCSARGYSDGFADYACFSWIFHSCLLGDKQSLIIADHDNQRLRNLNITSRFVSAFANLTKKPHGLALRPAHNEVYFSYPGGLGQVNIRSPSFVEYATPDFGTYGHSDGLLSQALFSNMPITLLFLSPKVMLVTDYDNHALRVINIVTDTVSTICGRGTLTAGEVSIKECALRRPHCFWRRARMEKNRWWLE